ncbi:MAG: hypothetical protein ACREEE_01420 [Dongiaceae bacterium]
MAAKPEDFARIYRRFRAPITRFDCGKKCAPLNGGEPVCCSTDHAIPMVQKAEWRLLKSRTDLWRKFKPFNAASRKLVNALHHSCTAIECKGAAFCERDNRSMACRAFPFFPYITRAGEFAGLAYYWEFEQTCWVISNLTVVDLDFVKEFISAHEALFAADPDEFETFRGQSIHMRREFSRRDQPIPLIGRDGNYLKVLPRTGEVVPLAAKHLPKHGPYESAAAYRHAVRAAAADDAVIELISEASL